MHNPPSKAKLFTLQGPIPASKITLSNPHAHDTNFVIATILGFLSVAFQSRTMKCTLKRLTGFQTRFVVGQY